MQNAGAIVYSVDIETAKTLAAQQRIDQGFEKMQGGMDKTDARAQKLGGGLSKLALSVAAVVSASAIRGMADLVQKYQEMGERVAMATSSQAEFEMVQKRLLETANATYRSLGEAQELYIRTADSLRSMGYSTAQALDVTDSMSFAFVKNATSADRANAAISALSKSVNTNKVAADQWETITSAIPTVIDDIATASGRTSKEVRALGAAGKLTGRDLTEGLRKSLDANAEAAAGMAANLTDAGVRVRTALTTVLVSLENQTGGLQAVTDGIVAAANAMQEFGADSEKMAAFLEGATTAATALAVVIGARLLAAVSGYTAALVTQAAASVQATRAADANYRLAQAETLAANAALKQAQATAAASIGLSTQAAAATALATAQARAGAAATAFTVAQTTANAAARVGTAVMGGLRTAMALLGGPAGVIFLAVGALAAFATSSTEAKPPVDLLAESVSGLKVELLKLLELDVTKKIDELGHIGGAAAAANAQAESLRKKLEEFPNSAEAGAWAEELIRQEGAAAKAGIELSTYQKRLAEVRAELAKPTRAPSAPGAPGAPPPDAATGPTGKTDAQRAADAIRDQVAALEAQADELGITGSALEIYRLQQAGATDEQIRAAQSSLALIDAYRMQGDAEEAMAARRKAFGADPAATIAGDVSPLSGGAFDDQFARYEAEKVAEELRYSEQLERLRQAKEAQIELAGGYQALEQEMAQTHADRLVQIEQAKSQMLIASGANLFGELASASAAFAGEQSGIYKVMFAASKAFAIADAAIKIQQGIAAAAALPFPANLGAMASVAAATGSIVSTIGSIAMTGRANGGPVQAGQMYRVNEGGAPEVYNAANGQQYMLPNQRGQVVSNAEASSGGGGVTNVITITVGESGAAVDSGSSSQDSVALAQSIRAVVVDELERQNRQGGVLWSMRNNG